MVGFNKLKEKIKEWRDPAFLRQKQLRKSMKYAAHYSAWSAAVKELAEIQGKSQKDTTAEWKRQTRLYDRKLLQQRLQHLQAVRQSGNLQQVIFALRQDLLRNLGNMTNRCVVVNTYACSAGVDDQYTQHPKCVDCAKQGAECIMPVTATLLCSELHEHFLAVPEPIRQYIDEVKTQLQMLTNYNGPSMTLKEKWEFIKLTRHAFGRTALVLSGGGALGAFHLVCHILAAGSFSNMLSQQSARLVYIAWAGMHSKGMPEPTAYRTVTWHTPPHTACKHSPDSLHKLALLYMHWSHATRLPAAGSGCQIKAASICAGRIAGTLEMVRLIACLFAGCLQVSVPAWFAAQGHGWQQCWLHW